jgi:hypothetical protein
MTGKPEEPLIYQEEPLPNGYVSYSVTQQMLPPSTGPNVRGCAIYIPRQQDVPGISVSIVSSEAATQMAVYSLKVNEDVAGFMQIAIEAQPILNSESAAGLHYCNLVAIGRPLAAVS